MTKEPGDPGTTVGQIKTSMCPENVGRKNTPGTHSFAKATGGVTGASSGSAGAANSIKGPGREGTAGPLTKKGSNAPGRW